MKTRERILQTCLALFNEEGVPNVTTLDIANEMEISPGNLYYHFKGKEAIIPELYDRFDVELTNILKAPIDNPLSVEDNWFFLYVVFEEIYANRFIYRNLTDIIPRFERIQMRFRRLLELKVRTARAICDSLAEAEILVIRPEESELLANSIAMTITYWLSYRSLRGGEPPTNVLMHQGVFQVMSLIAPYFAEHQKSFYENCQALYREVLGDELP